MGAPSPVRFFRFGTFQFDLRARELRRNGIKVRVPDQSIQVLAMLLEHPGEVVTRKEVHHRLWPNGTIVEFDHSINAAIKRLRQALEDSADAPRYVETLPRLGYRFIGAVEQGPAQDAAVPSAEPDPSPGELEGEIVSHYRILDKLGSGGMGVVYMAEDPRLGRTVALKFLADEFTGDNAALDRFQREARAASALNHPNICTLYDIGQADGRPFLAMEFLEGQTLLQLIATGPLTIDRILDLGIQIADALDAAHAKGIEHRDIKPSNIFVTARAAGKIMDFGVAKMAHLTRTADSEALLTNPGSAVGTAAYMSPEQARGEPLDARTDLFSFGVVLYEMATGQRPFQGDTMAAIFDAILNKSPISPVQLRPDLPAGLEVIIHKALEKDRDVRCPTALELRAHLNRIKRDTEPRKSAAATLRFGPFRIDLAGRKLLRDETHVPLAPKAFETLLLLAGNPGQILEKQELMDPLSPDTEVEENNLAQNISAIRNALGNVADRRRWIVTVPGRGYRFDAVGDAATGPAVARTGPKFARWTWVAAVTMGLLVVVIAWRLAWSPTVVRHGLADITRLTDSGDATRTVISPDGRNVAIVRGMLGSQQLTIRDLTTGRNLELAPRGLVTYMGLTSTPDGNELYAVLRNTGDIATALYRSATDEGEWIPVITGVDSPVTFSPDGQRFAFVREDVSGGHSLLIIRDLRGREIVAASRPAPEMLDYPAWSPDGSKIACTIVNRTRNVAGLLAIRLSNATHREIGTRKWSLAKHLAWVGIGDLVIAARRPGDEVMQLWDVSISTGQARRLTADFDSYDWFSVTRDGRMIAASRSRTLTSIWAVEPNKPDSERQIAAAADGYGNVAGDADGTLVFTHGPGHVAQVYRMHADGSQQVRLTTSAGNHYLPKPCGPGGLIVYMSEQRSGLETWMMDADGSNAHPVFRHNGWTLHDCSPDGRWIVHTSSETGWQRLWRTSSHGSIHQKLSDGWAMAPSVSPNGRWIAAFYAERPANTQYAPEAIAILPFEGGAPLKVFPIDDSVEQRFAGLAWMPGSAAVSYVRNENGVGNVWVQPMSGGPPRKVTNFARDRVLYFGWSRDGATVFVTRAMVTTDAMLMHLLE
jgi:serine/threonine protein kinase/Tol biopolymer transport system component